MCYMSESNPGPMWGRVLLGILLFCMMPIAWGADSMGMPRVSPGDSWHYHTPPGTDETEEADSVTQVGLVQPILVGDTQVLALPMVASNYIVQYMPEYDGYMHMWYNKTTWYRPNDLATIRVIEILSPAGAPMLKAESELTYTTPCLKYHFPLHVGNNWTYDCPWTERSYDSHGNLTLRNGTSHASFEVTRLENRTVPAGTFPSFLVHPTDADDQAADYFAEDACGSIVEIQPPHAPSELVDYHCAATSTIKDASHRLIPTSPMGAALALIAGAACITRAWIRRRLGAGARSS